MPSSLDGEHKNQSQQPPSPLPISSRNSGSYNPGSIGNEEGQSPELSTVIKQQDDLMLEEFPEGPYGGASNPPLGKSTPWQPGQRTVSSHRDQNPIDSNRTIPLHEPSSDSSIGSEEGQNESPGPIG